MGRERAAHAPSNQLEDDAGPVLRYLAHRGVRKPYERAIVLVGDRGATRAEPLLSAMHQWVTRVDLHELAVCDPSDYSTLYSTLAPFVELVRKQYIDAGWSVDVLLSAGTPQAQTIWVILVQAGLLPARMFQVIPPAFVPSPHPVPVREVTFDIRGFPQMRVLEEEIVRLRAELRVHTSALVAVSPVMRAVQQRIIRVAGSTLPVLLLGETGTGKELAAREIHTASARAQAPFIAENCGALAEGVLASELFGHEAGAFTGAAQRHRGLFEQADQGTLFLDEIGEMPLSVQAMLLRVLQEGTIRRIGAEKWLKVNVRIIAATHRDLSQMIQAGTFREDLYYRLAGVAIKLPPLRERIDDIPILIERFLQLDAASGRVQRVSRAAMRCLQAYSWPGNVRQLRTEVQRWSVFAGSTVQPDDLSDQLRGVQSAEAAVVEVAPTGGSDMARGVSRTCVDPFTTTPSQFVQTPAPSTTRSLASRPLAMVVAEAERAAVTLALEVCAGNLSHAARLLDIERNTLKRKLYAFGLYPLPGAHREEG